MKKFLSRFLVAVFILTVGLSLYGCGKPSTNTAKETTVGDKNSEKSSSGVGGSQSLEAGMEGNYTIGLSWFNMTSEYLANLKDHIDATVKEQGLEGKVKLIFLDAQSDPNKQNSQVDNLISQKVDAIVIIPFDREQQAPAIEAAKAANIPIIELCASTSAVESRSAYVGSDDLVSGKLLMQQLADEAEGKGKMVILHGPAGQNAEIMRHTGAEEILANYPDIEVVTEKVCDWDRAKALDAMNNIIQSGMEFNIVFAENDEMAMGASIALKAAGRSDVVIGGIDAIPDALQAVEGGALNCTVFQNAKAQAEKAVEVALKAAKGEKLDPLYDIPYELVVKDNVSQYK